MNINDAFLNKFERFGKQYDFLNSNVRILIGFSGGPDSLAMTTAFLKLRSKYSLFIACAHINYHLREADSNDDEKFVKEYCFNNNIPLYLHDVKEDISDSIQVKAREIRLSFFRKLKKMYKLNYIALGHHAQDQSETILHRFIRGAGFTGLSGMNAVNNDVIHPVLNFSKDEILSFLEYNKLTARTDLTNLTNKYTRNKIRNELIPYLKKEFNPNIEQRLVEYGILFNLSENYFKHQAKKEFKRAVIIKNNSDIILDINYLNSCFDILKFYIFKEAWIALTGKDKDFYSIHYNDIVDLLESAGGYKELFLPENIKIMRDYQYLIFRNAQTYQSPIKEENRELTGIRNIFTFNDRRFSMQKLKQLPEEGVNLGYEQVIVDLDKIIFPITLRYKNDGDKFIPLGMTNFKKLKNFFIDEKIPKIEREFIVIFTDAEKIFWISGCRLDHRVAVTEETKNFLVIKLENLGDFKNRSAERKTKKRG